MLAHRAKILDAHALGHVVEIGHEHGVELGDIDGAAGGRIGGAGGRFLLLINHPMYQGPESGFVDDQSQADREVQLAKAVDGVTSVDSKLMIKDGKSSAGNVLDDSVITVKVKSALVADDQTRGSEIAVTTNKGIVQLGGFVDSADQQARAASVARTVEGVQSVVNDTSIKK